MKMPNSTIFVLFVVLVALMLVAFGKEFQFGTEAEHVASYLKSSENHDPRPPVLFIPGILASRMVAWKRKKCIGPDIEIQDIVWLNLQKLAETMTFDKRCWLDCMKLQLNGSDPHDCKIRPDEGISAVGELSPGNLFTPSSTSVFTDLIRMLARELGYDSNNIISVPYDWRLSPQALEKRDSFFTTMKFKIESAVKRHNRPAIIIAHSMGNNMFMYFCEWLRMVDKPKGGWRRWLRRHIWAYVGYAAPILGAPGALKAMLSGHTFGLPISDAQARELLLTFPSTLFLNPRPPPAARRDHSNNDTYNLTPVYNYEEPLVTIKSSTGSSTVQFGISDVQSGDFYRWTGDIFRDQQIKHQARVLREQFLDDPLQPLTMPYRRPPIKHVIMVYGVDLPTESAFQYRTIEEDTASSSQYTNSNPSSSQQQEGSAAPGAVLDAIFVEDSSACMQSQQQQLQQQSMLRQAINPLNKQAHLQSNNRNSVEKAAVVCAEGDDTCVLDEIDDAAGSDSNNHNYDHIKSLVETNNNLALQTRPSYSSSDDNVDETITSEENKNIEEQCLADIFSVQPSRRLQRAHVRKGTLPHSGDTTVPYVSLSYAKIWLDELDTTHKQRDDQSKQPVKPSNSDAKESNISAFLESMFNYILMQFDITRQHASQTASLVSKHSSAQNTKWTEYRAARIHSAKHVLDNWAQNNKVIDPAIEMFHAQHANTDTTLVMEVSGIDHLAITKNTYVFKLVLDHLLPKMATDLCLDGACQPYYEAPREVEVSTAVATTTQNDHNNNNWFFFNPR